MPNAKAESVQSHRLFSCGGMTCVVHITVRAYSRRSERCVPCDFEKFQTSSTSTKLAFRLLEVLLFCATSSQETDTTELWVNSDSVHAVSLPRAPDSWIRMDACRFPVFGPRKSGHRESSASVGRSGCAWTGDVNEWLRALVVQEAEPRAFARVCGGRPSFLPAASRQINRLHFNMKWKQSVKMSEEGEASCNLHSCGSAAVCPL